MEHPEYLQEETITEHEHEQPQQATDASVTDETVLECDASVEGHIVLEEVSELTNKDHEEHHVALENQQLLYEVHEVMEEIVLGPTEYLTSASGVIEVLPDCSVQEPCELICSVCNNTFADREQLDQHLLDHIDKPLCHICGTQFDTKDELSTHNALVHSHKKKSLAHKSGKNIRIVNIKRLPKNHNAIPFHSRGKTAMLSSIAPILYNECNICKETFSDRFTLSRHYMLHIGIEDYKLKTFTEVAGSRSREKKQDGMETCKICYDRLSDEESLQNHYRIHHCPPPAVKFGCTMCPKGYNHEGHLRRHLTAVHGCSGEEMVYYASGE